MEPKIIFMGTGSFAGTILKALLGKKYSVAAIFTKPDKTVHKNSAANANEVKEIALKNNLPLFQPEKLDADVVSQIKNIAPGLIVIVAYGKIIPQEIIAIPQFGCVNVHPSLLPKFRGPSPIQNALLAGEKETGTTMMLIDEKMDTGDILSQEKMAIDQEDTYPALSEKLAALSAGLLLETLPRWIKGEIKPIPQDDTKASLCQLIDRQDGRIIWDKKAENIHDRYRALSPWPGIFTFWKNKGALVRLKLQKISLAPGDPAAGKRPGEVFRLEDRIAVQTMQGAIILEEIQMEGKKTVSAKDFANGHPDLIGSVLQ